MTTPLSANDPLAAQAAAIAAASLPSAPAPPPPPTGRLYAISDLHLSFQANRTAWAKLQPHPDDGLILAGDVGESLAHLDLAFSAATRNFRAVWWVPGNHELYTLPHQDRDSAGGGAAQARGAAKYAACVAVARRHGVHTPEDRFVAWTGAGGERVVVAPVFTLYDYSFRPADVSLSGAVAWAREAGVEATDEVLLHADPYGTREEWCSALVGKAEARLAEAVGANPGVRLVIVNHWPLREELVKLWTVPRFCIWCGTKKTEDWHTRFAAKVVVSGHLHIRRTDFVDGVRFEEVSWGYPRQWKDVADMGKDINDVLREIMPGPEVPASGTAMTKWRRYG